MDKLIIREASRSDEAFLREMLYHSLHVSKGSAPFERGVVNRPEISMYVEGWGRPGDLGLIAAHSESKEEIGAAWMRLFSASAKGYGFVDENIPELAMAVLPAYRGFGAGTMLLHELIERSRATYQAISLSVSLDNRAVRLYERVGFERVGMCESSVTMLKRLRDL